MSRAAPRNLAPPHRAACRAATFAAAWLAAVVISGCGDGDHDGPPPRRSRLLVVHAAARADEPAVGAGVTVTAPSGPAGRGALARRLPLRFRGWHLSLAQLSARHGAYLVTTLPPPGRRATPAAAARLLHAAARAVGDDPGAYRPLVPMSALAGAHHDRAGR